MNNTTSLFNQFDTSIEITDTENFIGVRINTRNYPEFVKYKIDIKDLKERLKFRRINDRLKELK